MHSLLSDFLFNINLDINTILNFSFTEQVNDHSFLNIQAVTNYTSLNSCKVFSKNEQVSICKNNEIIFTGLPHNYTYGIDENNLIIINVTFISTSILLDIKKEKRFFQYTNHSYSDIINQSFGDSGDGGYNVPTQNSTKQINTPILQYNETDWEFILRLSSRLNTVAFTDSKSKTPITMLGVPNRGNIKESIKDIETYFLEKNYNGNKYVERFDKFEEKYENLEFDNEYFVADQLEINNSTYIISKKIILLLNGIVKYKYSLLHVENYTSSEYFNNNIIGLELEGTVREINGKQLKIELDIDKNRETYGYTWFDYSPYTNNGMYSMPLKNEKVVMIWKSFKDEDIDITHCVRTNPDKMPTNENKFFKTEHENMLSMLPSMLDITSPNSILYLSLGAGVSFESSDSIEIDTMKNLSFRSNEMKGSSIKRTTLKSKQGKITALSKEIHILANQTSILSDNKDNLIMPPAILPMDDFIIPREKAIKIIAATPNKTKV